MLRLLKASPRNRMIALTVLGAILAALFLGLGLLGVGPRTRPSDAMPGAPAAFEVAVEDSRKVVGFVESYGRRIDEAERRLAEKDSEVARLKSELKMQTDAVSALEGSLGAMKKDAPRAPRGAAAQDATGQELRPGHPGFLEALGVEAPPPARIQKVSLSSARERALEPGGRKKDLRIPAGSFAEATLLTGVYAPTEGGAHPVQLRVDLAWVGPNRSRIPLQGAFLIGKAVGEANSLRAVVQLEKLSYVRPDGEAVEVPVNGYATDQDGVMGLAGEYVWRIREAATFAALSGGISAAADAAAQRETASQLGPLGGVTSIVTGDIGKFAAARGASRASDEVGKIITRRLDELVPAIYVPNGKRLTVVLIDGVTLEGVNVSEVKDAASQNPYAGLDFDR